MSTGARVQFIRVDPTDPVRMASWIHHISRLTGAPATPTPAHPVVVWQLTAGNHRVLARGATTSASVEEAHDDVASVVAARERLVPRMVRLESSRAYGWLLLDGAVPVLTCARWYALERDRRESLRSARLELDHLADGGTDLAAPRLVTTKDGR
ncbi:MAG: hypothetical protein DI534_06150 [Leifsonia xyli]|nr:MAG: hypothetical protein DI534_06150 [Leifsonia xyli]